MNSQYWTSCLNSYLFVSTCQYLFLATVLIQSSSADLVSNILCRFDEGIDTTSVWTGQFLSGNVEYVHVDDKSYKLDSIDIELIGEIVYRKRNSKSSSMSTHYATFFKDNVNLRSADDKSSFLLAYGSHKWPFRFFLNASLPPSFDKFGADDPYIHYFLRIIFVRSEWYKTNFKKTIPIIVKHTTSMLNSTQLIIQKQNRNDVRLQTIFNNNTVLIGRSVPFEIDIRNPKQKLIHRITMTLIQYTDLWFAERTWTTIFSRNLDGITSLRDPHFHANFQLIVPPTVPPTFSFTNHHMSPIRSFILYYELRFKVHISGFFTNIHLKVPLILADHLHKE